MIDTFTDFTYLLAEAEAARDEERIIFMGPDTLFRLIHEHNRLKELVRHYQHTTPTNTQEPTQ